MAMRCVAALLLLLLNACVSTYTGHARDLDPKAFQKERGWTAVHGVPLYRQEQSKDCGPAALAMVGAYLKPELDVRTLLATNRDERVSVAELRDRARTLGLLAFVMEGSPEDLVHELKRGRPLIVGVAKPTLEGPMAHYEVVIGIHKETQRIATLDPAIGLRENSLFEFMSEWQATGRVLLVVLPQPSAEPASENRAVAEHAQGRPAI